MGNTDYFSWWTARLPNGLRYIRHTESQKQTPSCSGYGSTAALELGYVCEYGKHIDLSGWDAFRFGRIREDAGAYTPVILDGLKSRGVALEETVPLGSTLPPETGEIEMERKHFRIKGWKRINNIQLDYIKKLIEDPKRGLCLSIPIVEGYSNLYIIDKGMNLLMNSRGAAYRHLVHIMGYRYVDGELQFHFEDSHGPSSHRWGVGFVTIDFLREHNTQLYEITAFKFRKTSDTVKIWYLPFLKILQRIFRSG